MRKSRNKSTMALRVVDLISCIVTCGVKGLNKRFCILVPDCRRLRGLPPDWRDDESRWLLPHRVSKVKRSSPPPVRWEPDRRYGRYG